MFHQPNIGIIEDGSIQKARKVLYQRKSSGTRICLPGSILLPRNSTARYRREILLNLKMTLCGFQISKKGKPIPSNPGRKKPKTVSPKIRSHILQIIESKILGTFTRSLVNLCQHDANLYRSTRLVHDFHLAHLWRSSVLCGETTPSDPGLSCQHRHRK